MGRLVSKEHFGNVVLGLTCRWAIIVIIENLAGLILLWLVQVITSINLYLLMIRELTFSSIINHAFHSQTALFLSISLIYQFTFPMIIYRILMLIHF